MDERLLSKPLDVHHLSEHKEVKKVINQILAEMKDSGALGRSPVVKIRKHLKVVVLDLYLTYSSDPLAYVAYSRRATSYSKTRLSQLYLNYRPMMRVVDGLVDLGYIENHKGFLDRSRGLAFSPGCGQHLN